MKIFFSTTLIIFCFCQSTIHSQNIQKNEYYKVVKGISNKKIEAMIPTSVGWQTNGNNNPLCIVIVSQYEDSIQNKYGIKLYNALLSLLQSDNKRDWAALLLLYRITNKNASNLISYIGNIKRWRLEKKQEEIIYWKNYYTDHYNK